MKKINPAKEKKIPLPNLIIINSLVNLRIYHLSRAI